MIRLIGHRVIMYRDNNRVLNLKEKIKMVSPTKKVVSERGIKYELLRRLVRRPRMGSGTHNCEWQTHRM